MKEKFRKIRKNKDFIEIFGIHSAQAALKNNKRIHKKLIIYSNLRKKFKYLEHNIDQIISIPKDEFIKKYGNEKNHQGIILITSKLKSPFTNKTHIYEMNEIAGIDIDTEIDFKIVEFLMEQINKGADIAKC